MREIRKIIIHCSATQPKESINAETIRKYHVEVNKWSDIGYHFVIKVDGTVENGRPIEQIGAHCQGHNADSIGICLVGGIDENGKSKNNFTPKQFQSLRELVAELIGKYPNASVHGHNEFAQKDCPCFDVQEFLRVTDFRQGNEQFLFHFGGIEKLCGIFARRKESRVY